MSSAGTDGHSLGTEPADAMWEPIDDGSAKGADSTEIAEIELVGATRVEDTEEILPGRRRDMIRNVSADGSG